MFCKLRKFPKYNSFNRYLLSTTKKKRNKDIVKEDQKNSNNMSELLGLCSGTFSNEPKEKSEGEHDMNELLDLCSGKFSDAPKTKVATESEENMNELLGLCSGKFTNEKKANSESQNMSDLLGLCSGTFSDKNAASKSETQNMNELVGLCSGEFNEKKRTDSTSESQNMDELLGLCSGKFDDKHSMSKTQTTSDLLDSKTNTGLQSESREKGKMIMNGLLRMCSGQSPGVSSTKNSGNEKSAESGIFSALSENEKRKPKSKQGLSAMFEKVRDEESSMDDVINLCSGLCFFSYYSVESLYLK